MKINNNQCNSSTESNLLLLSLRRVINSHDPIKNGQWGSGNLDNSVSLQNTGKKIVLSYTDVTCLS